MNRPYEREPSERLGLFVAFLAAAAIFAGGLYLVLKKAAPMAAISATARVTEPIQPALPASGTTTSATQPRLSAPHEIPNQGPTVYRCTVNGAAIYSDTPCPGGKLIDITPASSGFVSERPRPTERVAQAPSAHLTPTPSVESPSATERAKREARCAFIEAEVEQIDALARQGQSAASQDALRERRRKLVDEKYALKC